LIIIPRSFLWPVIRLPRQLLIVMKEEFGGRTILIDVINPVVEYLGTKNFAKVGVIGTKRTISSGTYENKVKERSPATSVVSMATPLLVP